MTSILLMLFMPLIAYAGIESRNDDDDDDRVGDEPYERPDEGLGTDMVDVPGQTIFAGDDDDFGSPIDEATEERAGDALIHGYRNLFAELMDPVFGVKGGDGDDYIDLGHGDDAGFGGKGDDTIRGNLGDDLIVDVSGADSLHGGYGDDVLVAIDAFGDPGDVLDGGHGDDELWADGGDTMIGGQGDDGFHLIWGPGEPQAVIRDYQIEEEDGDDYLSVFTHGVSAGDTFAIDDTETGSVLSINGESVVHFDGRSALEMRGEDIELIDADSQEVIWSPLEAYSLIQGTDQDDIMLGTSGADDMWGYLGRDELNGFEGDDTLRGGFGADTLRGGEGDDLLDGGAQDDRIYGGLGDDTLLGGDGHDFMQGGMGQDDLLGGAGNDTLEGNEGNDSLSGGAGNDLIRGGDGADSTALIYDWGGTAADHYAGDDTILGEGGDDYLIDNYGSNLIDGGAGDDILISTDGETMQDGTSTLIGGLGNDTLVGEGGDSLTGGAGQDEFVSYHFEGAEPVIVSDFNPDQDRLQLYGDDITESGVLQLVDAPDASGTLVQIDGVTHAVLQGITSAQITDPSRISLTFGV